MFIKHFIIPTRSLQIYLDVYFHEEIEIYRQTGYIAQIGWNHVHMPVVASTGLVLVRCCQYRPSTGPVLAHMGIRHKKIYIRREHRLYTHRLAPRGR